MFNQKNKSIGKKVCFIIATVLIIVFSLKTIYESVKLYNTAITGYQNLKLEETKKLALYTQNTLSRAQQIAKDVKLNIETTLSLEKPIRKRDLLIKNIKKMVEINTDLYAMGVYFDDNAFDGQDEKYINSKNPTGRFAYYAHDENSKVVIDQGSQLFQDSILKEYYDKTLSQNKTLLSEPYKKTELY